MLKVRNINNLLKCSFNCINNSNLLQHEFVTNWSFRMSIRNHQVSTINDLSKYISSDKPLQLKLVSRVLKTTNFENITNDEALLLLSCCGVSIVNTSMEARNTICQEIYECLTKYNKLNINIYQKYIEICIQNGIKLNSIEFLNKLEFQPTRDIYHLLLKNVCEKADIGQAYCLLEAMKVKSISAGEDTFNYLVLAHTMKMGFEGADSVLVTMRAAHIPETFETKFAILKGILRRNNYDEFKIFLQKYPLQLDQVHLIDILKDIGLYGNESWLPEMKLLYGNIDISKDFINLLKNVCTHLVYMNRSETAMVIYEHFVPPSDDESGFFIVENMLYLDAEIERILKVARHLQDRNLNSHIFEKLTEIALRQNYVVVAWRLLKNIPVLKPHYFWPLLIDACKNNGEEGVLKTIKEINGLNVKLDSESLELYVIPFCNLQDPKSLIQKFKDLGFTVKELLSPLILVLLKNRQVKDAAFLCKYYKVEISGNHLLKQLASSWYNSKDAESIVTILQKYCENGISMHDIVRDFLIKTLVFCKDRDDFKKYLSLVKVINGKRLKLSESSLSVIQNMISSKCKNDGNLENILQSIDTLLDYGFNAEMTPYISHPRDMGTNELECHLVELQEKNMKTRGILRRLIQQHAKLGNFEKIEQFREQFLSEGYEETLGMKSNLMHTYILCSKLKAALEMYKEIKSYNSKFTFDDFKILDLASLLVKEERSDEAMQIMENESKMRDILGGKAIERNCVELLKSYRNEREQTDMYKFLIEKGYCKATNVILGPLVRIHLKRGDIEKAAKTYINLIDKYKHTPLQLEVIREVLKLKDEVLLQTVLDATTSVHGKTSTQVVLIAALSENGNRRYLENALAKNTLPIRNHLEKRCERWVDEGKVQPLLVLAEACKRLPSNIIDVDFLFQCIIKIHDMNNDFESLLKFNNYLLENEYIVNQNLAELINRILSRCYKKNRN